MSTKRDRYFRHKEGGTINVIFIPADWPTENDPEDGECNLGYGSTRLVSNDHEIDTLWYSQGYLTDEITENEARAIHPALFAHLGKIDKGEI